MNRPWMVALAMAGMIGSATPAMAYDRDIYDPEGMQPGWLCQECRDPATHPEDYAAFAYNAYWGPNAWAWGSILGIPFRVYNMQLEWVVVWFEDFFLDVPSLLPNTLQIKMRLQSGEVISIEVIQDGPDMPIGAEDDSDKTTDSCLCGDSGGSGGGRLSLDGVNSSTSFGERSSYSWSTTLMPVGRVEIIDM